MGKGKAKTMAAAPAHGGPPYPEEQQQHGAAAGAAVNTEIFGAEPTKTACPNCKQLVMTETKLINGRFAWLVALISGLFSCMVGCCVVLCCIDSCKDVEHYCPKCKTLCGKYRRW